VADPGCTNEGQERGAVGAEEDGVIAPSQKKIDFGSQNGDFIGAFWALFFYNSVIWFKRKKQCF